MANTLPYEKDAQELLTELYRIYDEDETAVLGVLSCVSDYEDDVKELLAFIKAGEDVTQESVSVYAADLDDARNPED